MEDVAIPRPTVPEEVLSNGTGDGETDHDYGFILLDYARRPEYEGPGPVNLDMVVKLRCSRCGKVICPNQDSLADLRSAFQPDGVDSPKAIDWDSLLGSLPSHTLPEGVGRFDVRRIDDDGTMEVVSLESLRSRAKRGRMPRLTTL